MPSLFSRHALAKYFIAISLVSSFLPAHAFSEDTKRKEEPTVVIKFAANEIHGLYSFVQGLAGTTGGSSPTLTDIFNKSPHNTPSSQTLLNQYRSVNTSYSYEFNDELRGRNNTRQIWQLLTMASTQSADLTDFQQRTFGLLNNNDHKTMMATLRYFAPIYKELVWSPSQEWLGTEIQSLSKAAAEGNVNQHFNRVKHFYQTDWNNEIPFKVYIAPIPSNSGMTVVTPQGNIVSFSTLHSQDPTSQLSIMFHELVHILFENQSITVQKALEKAFLQSTSPYRIYAYQLLDEALATAIGNGWFYKQQRNELDSSDWYHTPFINQQAKSVYPLIEQYLGSGKALDQEFVTKFIKLYEQNFPDSHLSVQNIFANTSLLTDPEVENDNRMYQAYFENLQFLRSIKSFAPIDDHSKINEFKDSISTRFILVVSDQEQKVAMLKEHFPWLKQINTKGSYVATHYAEDGVAELLFVLDSVEQFNHAIKVLVERERLKANVDVIML